MFGYGVAEKIIRPSRKNYGEEFEMEHKFDLEDKNIERDDFNITNSDNQKQRKSVVVYAHSLTGNKLEGCFALNYFLPHQAVLLFDFIGCGNSEGKYVSYGVKESLDLEKIVKVLIKRFNFDKVYLWGRGLGSVAIINFVFDLEKKRMSSKIDIGKSLERLESSSIDEDKKIMMKKQIISSCLSLKTEENSRKSEYFLSEEKMEDFAVYEKIKGIVLDSPFPDLRTFILNYLFVNFKKNKRWTNMFFFNIVKDIKKKVGIDIFKNNAPIEKIPFLRKPCILMISENDEYTPTQTSIDMFNNYGSNLKKMRIMLQCTHEGERPAEDLYYSATFLQKIDDGFYKENICIEDQLEENIQNEKSLLENNLESSNFVSYTKKSDCLSESNNDIDMSDINTVDFLKDNSKSSNLVLNSVINQKKNKISKRVQSTIQEDKNNTFSEKFTQNHFLKSNKNKKDENFITEQNTPHNHEEQENKNQNKMVLINQILEEVNKNESNIFSNIKSEETDDNFQNSFKLTENVDNHIKPSSNMEESNFNEYNMNSNIEYSGIQFDQQSSTIEKNLINSKRNSDNISINLNFASAIFQNIQIQQNEDFIEDKIQINQNEYFNEIEKNEEVNEIEQNEEVNEIEQNEEVNEIEKNEDFNELEKNEYFNEIEKNEEVNEIEQNEEVNEIEQNEEVNEIEKNEDFNELEKNEEVNEIEQNEEVNEIEQNEEVNEIEQNEEVNEIEKNEDFNELEKNEYFNEIEKNEEVNEIEQNEEVNEIEQNEEVNEIEKNEDFNELEKNEEVNEIEQNEEVNEIEKNEDFNELEKNEYFNEIEKNEEVNEIEQNEEVNEIEQNEEVNEIEQNEEVNEIEKNEDFNELEKNEEVNEIEQNEEVNEIEQNEEVNEIEKNEDFNELEKNENLEKIVNDNNLNEIFEFKLENEEFDKIMDYQIMCESFENIQNNAIEIEENKADPNNEKIEIRCLEYLDKKVELNIEKIELEVMNETNECEKKEIRVEEELKKKRESINYLNIDSFDTMKNLGMDNLKSTDNLIGLTQNTVISDEYGSSNFNLMKSLEENFNCHENDERKTISNNFPSNLSISDSEQKIKNCHSPLNLKNNFDLSHSKIESIYNSGDKPEDLNNTMKELKNQTEEEIISGELLYNIQHDQDLFQNITHQSEFKNITEIQIFDPINNQKNHIQSLDNEIQNDKELIILKNQNIGELFEIYNNNITEIKMKDELENKELDFIDNPSKMFEEFREKIIENKLEDTNLNQEIKNIIKENQYLKRENRSLLEENLELCTKSIKKKNYIHSGDMIRNDKKKNLSLDILLNDYYEEIIQKLIIDIKLIEQKTNFESDYIDLKNRSKEIDEREEDFEENLLEGINESNLIEDLDFNLEEIDEIKKEGGQNRSEDDLENNKLIKKEDLKKIKNEKTSSVKLEVDKKFLSLKKKNNSDKENESLTDQGDILTDSNITIPFKNEKEILDIRPSLDSEKFDYILPKSNMVIEDWVHQDKSLESKINFEKKNDSQRVSIFQGKKKNFLQKSNLMNNMKKISVKKKISLPQQDIMTFSNLIDSNYDLDLEDCEEETETLFNENKNNYSDSYKNQESREESGQNVSDYISHTIKSNNSDSVDSYLRNIYNKIIQEKKL